MLNFQRILIADDNRDAADTLAIIFESLGYQTAVAYDGEQAVAVARDFAPQVVILDISMPVMDGYEATRALRRSNGGKVIVALTALDSPGAKTQAAAAGFDAHVTKPVEVGVLLQVIERQLGS